MTNSEDRILPWRLENMLAAGFFLIILLGLLGYFQTVHAMQESARRTHRLEEQVNSCIASAKDVALHSHDASFFALSYLSSSNPSDRDQYWEEQDSTHDAFSKLQSQLVLLPHSRTLQAQCAAARQQNLFVCEAQEQAAILWKDRGQQQQAAQELQTNGAGGRDNLEVQLDTLMGEDHTQYANAPPSGLIAYRLQSQAAARRKDHRTLILGEIVQGLILTFSLLIAVAVIRTASTGVQTVLRVQDNLRESEARYRVLFDSNPHPMGVFDQSSLRYLAVNDAALQIYGYTRDEFLALSFGGLRADGERSAYPIAENSFVEDTLKIGERRHKKKDGSGFWVDVVLHPLQWDGHGACLAVIQDITARRTAEVGLNRLAAIVSSSHDAIIGWGPDRNITSWNPGAERLYGWTAEEMVGRSVLEMLPPQKLRSQHALICETLLAGKAIELPDTLRLHKDGHLLEVWVSTSPILNREGEVVGASTISRDISEQKKTQALIRWQAHNDPLTRLPNRAAFQESLEEAISRRQPFAILFVDLDQFKHINDSLGHAAGDQLLREVAARFERCLGPGDRLARMGGDEFTLLLPTDAVSAAEKAAALLRTLARPMTLESHELHIAASIGISRFPEDGEDAETLLKYADLAMYQAKEGGRGQWHAFSPVLTEAATERLTLESSLRKAIERDEMILLYQPQVSLSTGVIVGTEALVRWQHPDLGLVSPARFIPLAEETGLIVPLGRWVLRTACRQAAAWERAGTPLRQSVNLSARQLGEQDLVKIVRTALEESGLSPQLLDLELTESALVAQGEVAVERLKELRALGVRISIDDFGTGYSSLSYLRRFPLDVLKVDRSFVQELNGSDKRAKQDQAVVRAIIDMAHALELEVVAEGVENVGQREMLTRLSCDIMQGYLFSPPVTPQRLEALLQPGSAKVHEAQAA